jgi:hypothetical protein
MIYWRYDVADRDARGVPSACSVVFFLDVFVFFLNKVN